MKYKQLPDHIKPGSIIYFAFPDSGYPSDKQRAKKYLFVNNAYRVGAVAVEAFRTDLTLEGLPGLTFNSVMFGILE